MKKDFVINSRNGLIDLGQRIAKQFVLSDGRAKTVVINGAGNSGKSLIALAIDSVFRPHLYKDGIDEDIAANERLDYCKHKSLPVIFNNFCFAEYPLQDFTRTLDDYVKVYPQAKVIIGSNFIPVLYDEFTHRAEAMKSNSLDMYIHVPFSSREPERKIEISVKNKELMPAMF